ncbi:hypothetical protein [Pseudobutyrivibrio sp. YE44]|uniref:hypothetical protein n=1 Tax=Pseudobutyrivibrio sp. YE44 TaxID=1520802 RepID=UPI0015A042FB|nr:hypothetical protein [Pseudobutyrivibrio sp. YE44]
MSSIPHPDNVNRNNIKSKNMEIGFLLFIIPLLRPLHIEWLIIQLLRLHRT